MLFGQRIKDIAYFTGETTDQILGYGLVVGLAGTGDSYRTSFTMQSITSMLKRFGITVPQTDLKTRNVAAVMVTATLGTQSKQGASFDVVVSLWEMQLVCKGAHFYLPHYLLFPILILRQMHKAQYLLEDLILVLRVEAEFLKITQQLDVFQKEERLENR